MFLTIMDSVTQIGINIGVIAGAIALLGVCIFVHEFGHLFAALKRNLYVERFSIGFGKKIWSKTINGVEYVVSSLFFFGGYVALPQLEPTDTPMTEKGEPLPKSSPFDRSVTALAGPSMNLLFGFLLATMLWWVGIEQHATDSLEIATVEKGSKAAEAGLQRNDEILAVNGKTVEKGMGWRELVQEVVLTKGPSEFMIKRGDKTFAVQFQPEPHPERENLSVPRIDIKQEVFVDWFTPGSPAKEAGLQEDDRLARINGKPVDSTIDVVESVNGSNGKPIDITVIRPLEDGGKKTMTFENIVPESKTVKDAEGKEVTRYMVGIHMKLKTQRVHIPPWRQIQEVFLRTTRTLGAVTSAKSSVNPTNLSGPLGIMQILYVTIRYGDISEILKLMVLINVGLAFMNLLPIPVLDGGHIMFSVIEGVARRPLPQKLLANLQTVFAVLLIGFMLFISVFDIGRFRYFFGSDEPVKTEDKSDASTEKSESNRKDSLNASDTSDPMIEGNSNGNQEKE